MAVKKYKLKFALRNKDNWNRLRTIVAIIPFPIPATMGALLVAEIVDTYIEGFSDLPIINHRYHRLMISYRLEQALDRHLNMQVDTNDM